MENIQYKTISQTEIDAIVRDAHKLRAEATARWVRAAVNWLMHPGSSHRHA